MSGANDVGGSLLSSSTTKAATYGKTGAPRLKGRSQDLGRIGRFASKKGATGAYSPGVTSGAGLGKLAGKEIRITQKGLDLVEAHLKQFGDIPTNKAMVDRLRGAMKSGKLVSGADASFYLHEASEATMMAKGLGYDAAHAAALQKYGVSPFSVYHPEVISRLPGWFNKNWRTFWGMD